MCKTITSDFFCTQCKNKGIPIVRKKGQARECGHLKKIFCLKCQKETNHVEIKPNGNYTYEDFIYEFDNGNFMSGQRVYTINQMKARKKEEEMYG